MVSIEFAGPHVVKNEQKIVLLVMDGLGGLAGEEGETELEAAATPNMDKLAREGAVGLVDPVGQGITPGSGPAHFALFGYDPLTTGIGRGALAATGIGFELKQGDVAARINFCTVDESGNVTDRRAGRIATDLNARLCGKLGGMKIEGVELFVRAVKDHRAVVVFRGDGLSDNVSDTDPQETGAPPLAVTATDLAGEKTADIARAFIEQARSILADERPANMVLLRGFAESPRIARFPDVFKVRAGAIAVYPDYKGMARIAGMTVLDTGADEEDEIVTLEEAWSDYDFFYVHIKKTDSYGEDGNAEGKQHVIETVDGLIPRIMALKPDCLIVTGDHSTPALYQAHSWHPVPLLLWGEWVRRDGGSAFGETACASGGLGRFPSSEIMMLALGHTRKLAKYGA